jgi:ribosomal protein L13
MNWLSSTVNVVNSKSYKYVFLCKSNGPRLLAFGICLMPNGKIRIKSVIYFQNTYWAHISRSIPVLKVNSTCLLLVPEWNRNYSFFCLFAKRKGSGDCGDYVVVINSKEIALKNDLWRTKKFFHHTGYAKGVRYTPIWEAHEKDPTRVNNMCLRAFLFYFELVFESFFFFSKIIRMCIKTEMPNKLSSRHAMSRLLVFPDDVCVLLFSLKKILKFLSILFFTRLSKESARKYNRKRKRSDRRSD